MHDTEHPGLVSDRRLRTMLVNMPGFVTILAGPEHVFEFANAAYREISGGRSLIGLDVRTAFPELEGQDFFEELDRTYASGEIFEAKRMPLALQGDGASRYIDFVYQPMKDGPASSKALWWPATKSPATLMPCSKRLAASRNCAR